MNVCLTINTQIILKMCTLLIAFMLKYFIIAHFILHDGTNCKCVYESMFLILIFNCGL